MAIEQYPKVYLYRRIVQAKLFIDAYYATKIDLNNIAGEACFSKFHFIRLFTSIYGHTPHQYLKYVRIERAKELLQKGNRVTEVAYTVGFDSLSSFSGLFARTTGSTPSDYLKQQLQVQKQKSEHPLAFVPGCYAYQHGWLDKK